jgi:glutathione synthase/RimK-type ligase-like ATP-grasp enzyme
MADTGVSLFQTIKNLTLVKRIRKTRFYSRLRQYFPMPEPKARDDSETIFDADFVRVDWPANVCRPKFGIVQDFGPYPRWTKYRRFLENNAFDYGIYNIHAHDWLEQAAQFDIILGFFSTEIWHLQEMREKYFFLEKFLGKITYPSLLHANLYEDKKFEAYLAQLHGLPFIKTYISHDRQDALDLIEGLNYPLVSKIVPSSGSVGVELVRSLAQARKIVAQAFSRNGRSTHLNVFRQKNYVYFQDFIPNDGYDIRVIVVGQYAFGDRRRVLKGDFRASGMQSWEFGALPEEAVWLARKVYEIVRSPILAVDMLHGLDGQYRIIEFSPISQIDTPAMLMIDQVPGVYIFEDNEHFHFEPKRYWIHDLALREFLLKDYLPRFQAQAAG